MSADVLILGVLFLFVGFLYSSVGHAGASGYLAVMGLWGVSAAVMKPTSLTLNIVVAVIGTIQFVSAGHFRWRLFWPFALGSVPMAFLGGTVKLPPEIFKPLIGLVLLFSAWRMWSDSRQRVEPKTEFPSVPVGVGVGAVLGFGSVLLGTGGGIFLSPLFLLCKWANPKETAAASVAFILVNSMSGLTGAVNNGAILPAGIGVWCVAVAVGGVAGSYLGARRFGGKTLRRLLAVVLVFAGCALAWDGIRLALKQGAEAQPVPATK
ncbi:MAG: sulfite exporter TauE/SafE family protein [Phycisphaeraceae bacterium]|nr:sulfite exporter TauE/SafE family protein [Phycisphaeraceae bacterium]